MKALSYRSAGLLTTSLLLTGVSTLAPASVRAVGNDTCSFGGNQEFSDCSNFTFDKQVDKTLKLVTLPTTGAGTIQFNEATPGIWVVDVDFILDLVAGASGIFEYDLEIDPTPGNSAYFSEAGLAIIGPPVGSPMFEVKKQVKESVTGLFPLMLFADQANTNEFDSFGGLVKKISVVDTYSVAVGSINSFQNSYTQKELTPPPDTEVPGPLPLLGAGAAFGFSRRLRHRVLAARRG
jgi:hypothetical protein